LVRVGWGKIEWGPNKDVEKKSLQLPAENIQRRATKLEKFCRKSSSGMWKKKRPIILVYIAYLTKDQEKKKHLLRAWNTQDLASTLL